MRKRFAVAAVAFVAPFCAAHCSEQDPTIGPQQASGGGSGGGTGGGAAGAPPAVGGAGSGGGTPGPGGTGGAAGAAGGEAGGAAGKAGAPTCSMDAQAGVCRVSPPAPGTWCCEPKGALYDVAAQCWRGEPIPGVAGDRPPVEDTSLGCFTALCITHGPGCYILTLDGRDMLAYTANGPVSGLPDDTGPSGLRGCTLEEEAALDKGAYGKPICPP